MLVPDLRQGLERGRASELRLLETGLAMRLAPVLGSQLERGQARAQALPVLGWVLLA